MFGKWSGAWNVANSLHIAQHLGISMERFSPEREGVEGKVEMRGMRSKLGALFSMLLFSGLLQLICV